MKRIAILIPVLGAAMMLNPMPAHTEEGSMYGSQGQATTQKDECLLVAKNCVDSVDSLQQRINKLQQEIAKGSAVYTQDELRILNRKLDDANSFLIKMQENP